MAYSLWMPLSPTSSWITIDSSKRITALMSRLSNSCSDWVDQVSVKVLAASFFWTSNHRGKTATGAKQSGKSGTNHISNISDWIVFLNRKLKRTPNFLAFRQLFPTGAAVWGWMRCGLAAEQQRTSASPRSFPRDCRPFMGNAGACIPIRRTRCKSQPLWNIGETSEALQFYVVAWYANIKTTKSKQNFAWRIVVTLYWMIQRYTSFSNKQVSVSRSITIRQITNFQVDFFISVFHSFLS